MPLKSILSGISLFALLACPVLAAEPLAPRGEVSVKGGTDRSLLTTEFWAPLAQQSDRVLYGDIRLMGDNDDNREGNLGVGYRQIKNDAVVGVHGWIDRRRTQHNSTFHQLTFGVERLGHIVDARANIYVPINNGRNIITPNIGVTSPYLAGSGIYYDTNGSISETPQYGVDGELGYRIPVFQKQVDAIRVYGGGYYFFRDNTTEVPGARFRTEAQVNKAVSIGARVQYDKPRGTQGFLEATLKFPFSAKRLYQESGIRSRLDESPERDVDIVTNATVTDTGLRKPLIDAVTGTQQRILYVDNTKADGGDGSYEKPFNNLKAAEAALQANDIVYINRGDGTTRNMNQGIVIDKPNVQLIGSATPLTYGGVTFLNAGAAPVITNTATPVDFNDHLTGNGVLVTGDKVLVSGISISNAAHNGLLFFANGSGSVMTNATASNVTVNGSARRGIIAYALNGGVIENVSFVNNISNGNRNTILANGRGIEVRIEGTNSRIGTSIIRNNVTNNNESPGIFFNLASGGGKVDNIYIENNTSSNNNVGQGIQVSPSSGSIDNIVIRNNTVQNNSSAGINVQSNNSLVNKVTIENNISTNNTSNGISVQAQTNAPMTDVSIAGNTASANGASGIIVSGGATGSSIDRVTVRNNTANGNTNGRGVYITAGNVIKQITVSDITANNNSAEGVRLQADSVGQILQSSVTNIVANTNGASGVYIFANSGVINNTTLSNVTASSNVLYGVYLQGVASGVINGASLAGITANNNAQNGLYVSGANATNSVITNVSVSRSNFLNNTVNGIYLQKQNATATFNVDLGGGAYASVGQNRSSGNTGKDLRLNYTGGGAVFAKNNWWGSATGLQAGRVTLSASTTVDSSAFLTTDPRP